jgi:hypothetical protein
LMTVCFLLATAVVIDRWLWQGDWPQQPEVVINIRGKINTQAKEGGRFLESRAGGHENTGRRQQSRSSAFNGRSQMGAFLQTNTASSLQISHRN